MKLESLTLKNFQAHKDLEIVFAPGITTIKGPTDAGKSAVLRALRWVCLNDTAGVDFIREGTKAASVALITCSAGITRTKARDGSLNSYILSHVPIGGKGKEFKAFGQGVPADIAQALALNEINFQGQHDSPFWFADTAGEVSRKLNSVIDLSIIDTTLANIGSEVRRAVERKSLCEERLKEAKTQLEELAPQKDRVVEFKVLKVKQGALKIVIEDFNKLTDLLERASNNKAKTLKLQTEDGTALLATMLEARRAQRSFDILSSIASSISKWQSKAKQPLDFSSVRIAFEDWRDKRSEWLLLARLIELIDEARAIDNDKHFKAQQAEAKFHVQVRDKVCPLCNQTIQLDER